MIAGVCSGLAQYFSVQVWVPRLLFLIPFLSFAFRFGHWGWWDFPHFLSFSFSPGSIVVYIILWLVIPEAKSAADKLEMKGEKVDLNNIKTTIQSDLGGFKDRAQQVGAELREKAQEFGENIGRAGKQIGSEASAVVRRNRGGIGHVLGVLVKIFVYFVLGCILFGIVVGLFSAGVALTGLLPAYSYVLNDGYQKILSWCVLILFVWVPVIAIVTWIIRRLSGKKGSSGIIRLTFLSLWVLGLICFVNLIVTLRNEFRYRNLPIEQEVALNNPAINKLEIRAASFGPYYTRNWLKLEPFATFDEDTVYVRNIRLRLIKSNTDSFKVVLVKLANGNSKRNADQIVGKINFNVSQRDSVLLLDKGIAITRQDKFRNQQVIVTVAVPVGKRIRVNENVDWGHDERVPFSTNDDYWDCENNDESLSLRWRNNVDYVMTEKGLERVDRSKEDDDEHDMENSNEVIEEFRKSREQIEKEKQQKIKELEEIDKELQRSTDSTRYRYRPSAPDSAQPASRAAKLTAAKKGVEVPTTLNDLLMIKFAF
jgi:phage shock protein PspC (stress-responsive transcriptional regulator)